MGRTSDGLRPILTQPVPQFLLGRGNRRWVMILGVFVYAPSLYMLGWVLIWGVIGHWMIRMEEAHLRRVFGEEYEQYCEETPRYLFW